MGAAVKDTKIERLAFNPQEAANMIGCSKQSLYGYLEAGLLKSRKVHGRRYISKAALDEFLAAEKVA